MGQGSSDQEDRIDVVGQLKQNIGHVRIDLVRGASAGKIGSGSSGQVMNWGSGQENSGQSSSEQVSLINDSVQRRLWRLGSEEQGAEVPWAEKLVQSELSQ